MNDLLVKRLEETLTEIDNERRAQLEKWGIQTHDDDMWFKILMEEVGEVAKALLEETSDNVREEIIQVAAVAAAWAQCMRHGEA